MSKNWEDIFEGLSMAEKMNIDMISQLIVKMKEMGISQRELARRTGLKQSTLSRQFGFEVTMNVASLMKICEQLEVQPMILTPEEVEMIEKKRQGKVSV